MSRIRRSVPVVGLDLSLTSPAACLIPAGWKIGDWSSLVVRSWVTQPPASAGAFGAAFHHSQRYERLRQIVGWVRDFVVQGHAFDVFVEDYAFDRRSSSVTKLAELGGAVRLDLHCHGRTAIPVPAGPGRKVLLGALPRKDQKSIVQAAIFGAGVPKTWNGDIVDAFVIANYGRTELGLPALTLA